MWAYGMIDNGILTRERKPTLPTLARIPGTRRVVRAAALALFAAQTLLLAALPGALPLRAQHDQYCFPETGHCIGGRIRAYWEANGGLTVFGYPISPQHEAWIEGTPYQVQWFERNRLELHPQNPPPYDVLLGRLGTDRLEQQGRDWFAFPPAATPAPAGCLLVTETSHTICGDILAAWRAHGLELDGQPGTSVAESMALFGLPLSEPHSETLEGSTYTVQWFERARFEIHPQNPPPHHVQLGLLGNEVRAAPLAPPPTDPAAAITADSTIVAQPRATREQAVAAILSQPTGYTPDDVAVIVDTYWRTASEVGVDPLVAVAQALHETGNLTSWWSQRPRRNGCGYGVTGDTSAEPPPAEEAHLWAYDEEQQTWRKGISFATWEASVRAHIGRLLAYALTDAQATPAQRTLIDEALALRPLPASYRGAAPTLRGLNGRWAVPGETYADRIADYANRIRQQPE